MAVYSFPEACKEILNPDVAAFRPLATLDGVNLPFAVLDLPDVWLGLSQALRELSLSQPRLASHP